MLEIRFKKPVFGYTIIANTGETLGISSESLKFIESKIKEIVENCKNGDLELIKELCPDSDISEITELTIIPEILRYEEE